MYWSGACRALQFPGLINGTTIDWFLPWPEQALVSVAAKFLDNFEMACPDPVSAGLLPHAWDAPCEFWCGAPGPLLCRVLGCESRHLVHRQAIGLLPLHLPVSAGGVSYCSLCPRPFLAQPQPLPCWKSWTSAQCLGPAGEDPAQGPDGQRARLYDHGLPGVL